MKKTLYTILLVLLLLLVLIFPQMMFNATVEGVKLWFYKVIPGLFITFIITGCLNHYVKPDKKMGLIYIILSGLLCGFPIGAINCVGMKSEINKTFCNKKSVNTKVMENIIDNVIGYCNITSPSFLINYIYYNLLNASVSFTRFMVCTYSPVIILILFNIIKSYIKGKINGKKENIESKYNVTVETNNKKNDKFITVFDKSLNAAITNSLKLCGYIVIFSCVSALICKFLNAGIVTCVICGFIEITNGLYMTCNCVDNDYLKYIILMSTNAWGGVSTFMQTIGIVGSDNLNIKKYIYQKLMLTLLTLVISSIMIYVL